MALDPSIILANADPKRQFDPTDAMAKALQMKGMVQQQQLQQGQIAAQQQAVQDAAEFRAKHNVSPGMAQAEQKLQLGNLETMKAKHEAAKMELEALNEFKDQQWQTYSQANPQNWPQVKAQAMANAQAFAQKMGKPLPPGAGADDEEVFDPAKQDQRLKGLLTFDKQLKLAAQKIAEEKANAERWDKVETSTGFARFNRQTGEMQPIEGGLRPKPTATQINVGKYATPAGGGIESNPLYAQAKSISDLKQGLPARQGPQAAALNDLIAKIRQDEGKPPYDANQWTKVKRSNEYFTGNGKAATTLTSNDTLYGHADEVLETLGAAKLDDTRALNIVNQFISRQTGQDAKYKDLKVASKVYAMELAGMLGEKDMHGRQQIMDLFATVDSAPSFKSAVEQSKKMAATRSASLANQYYRETGLDPVEAGIIPERVAKGAVNSVAAKGYEWAKKYQTGGGGAEPPANQGTKPLPQSMIGTLPPKVAQDYLAGKKVKMTNDDGTITYYQKGK